MAAVTRLFFSTNKKTISRVSERLKLTKPKKRDIKPKEKRLLVNQSAHSIPKFLKVDVIKAQVTCNLPMLVWPEVFPRSNHYPKLILKTHSTRSIVSIVESKNA